MSAANIETINSYKEQFKTIVADYSRDQIYNADETGLNYKALPTKTLASLSEKYAPGHKMQKQRVTVMVCGNASGSHRMPLLVIGNAKKPRCFKGVNMNSLPVTYRNQTKAWMNQSIFIEWFQQVFVPAVQTHLKSLDLPPKAILFLDNAPAHPEETLKSHDGNIICRFLPANTTSIIQPMDHGVIDAMKRRYRKKFLQQLLHKDDEDSDLLTFWKKFNLKDVINHISDAWDEMDSVSLARAWNKLWPTTTEIEGEVEGENLTNTISQLTSTAFNAENDETVEWLNCDSEDAGYQLLTEEGIVDEFLESESESVDDDYDGANSENESTENATDSRLEAKEASAAIQKFMDWYQKQDESDMMSTMYLRKLRAIAERKSETILMQKKLSDYFQKK